MTRYHVTGKIPVSGAFVSVGKFETKEEIKIEAIYVVNGLALSEFSIVDATTGDVIMNSETPQIPEDKQ